MKYKLCEKYGLKIAYVKDEFYRDNADYMIQASEVEQLLSSGVEVFGHHMVHGFATDRPQNLTLNKGYKDTHSGLLIGYKPIEKEQPVSVDEIIKTLSSIVHLSRDTEDKYKDLINRLKLAGVK